MDKEGILRTLSSARNSSQPQTPIAPTRRVSALATPNPLTPTTRRTSPRIIPSNPPSATKPVSTSTTKSPTSTGKSHAPSSAKRLKISRSSISASPTDKENQTRSNRQAGESVWPPEDASAAALETELEAEAERTLNAEDAKNTPKSAVKEPVSTSKWGSTTSQKTLMADPTKVAFSPDPEAVGHSRRDFLQSLRRFQERSLVLPKDTDPKPVPSASAAPSLLASTGATLHTPSLTVGVSREEVGEMLQDLRDVVQRDLRNLHGDLLRMQSQLERHTERTLCQHLPSVQTLLQELESLRKENQRLKLRLNL